MPTESAPAMPSFEAAPVSREQALAAYKKFIERGIKSPDDLDLSDPEVEAANALVERWSDQGDFQISGENRAAAHEHNLAKTAFYVDAGFTDPEYLRDVLEWLGSDLQDVDETSDAPLPEVAAKIRAKMAEIQAKLPQ